MAEIKLTMDSQTASATATWQAGYAAGVKAERGRIIAWLRKSPWSGAAYPLSQGKP